MALCDVRFSSKVLGGQVGLHVIVPETGKPPFPTFYLLHGLRDDYTTWVRRTSIERYAASYPMIVVCPDGGRSFYTNCENGHDYASYIAKELVAFVERLFPVKKTRASRAVGGLSMGGYGALRLALGYPHVFCSATSHSGALMHGCRTFDKKDQQEYRRVFGRKPSGSDHDLLTLARRAERKRMLPRIRIDCGTEDFLLDDNRRFHARLLKLGVAHEYQEFRGGHDWSYWDAQVQQALRFHARTLRIRPIP